jgi:hyperosmotically inducible protein
MRWIIAIFSIVYLFFGSQTLLATNLQGIEQNLSDSVITTKITTMFARDPNLNPLKIKVSTTDGKVSLSGHVKNKEAFVKALKIASSIKGVRFIDAEDLEIRQVNTIFTDAYITAKVEAAVLKAKVLDDESIPLVGINASTKNGIVTLTGEVQNNKSLDIILKRVSAVQGVKQIISQIQIGH